MLIARPPRVFIVPLGGLLALLGLAALALADGFSQIAGGRVWIPCAVVATGILVHVLTTLARVERQGPTLRWRAFLASGEAEASSCALIAKLAPRPGRAPTLDLSLVRDDAELVELLSVPATSRGEAQINELAGVLELGWTRDDSGVEAEP